MASQQYSRRRRLPLPRTAATVATAAPGAGAPAAVQGSIQQQQQAEELPLLLTGVRVVLVAPKTPANIGAVLRVAENFEAHDVVVVDPRCDPRCDEVAVTSCNSRVLHSMCVVPTLADALAECTGSIGFTRRAGAGRVVHASMRQLLARFPAAVPALQLQGLLDAEGAEGAAGAAAAAAEEGGSTPGGTVALVFGREESGLLESELLLCSHACAIPTGRSQPSLNLSHAVAVVLSQLFDIQQQCLMLAQQREEQREEQQEQQQEQQEQQQGGSIEQDVAAAAAAAQDAIQRLEKESSSLSGSLFETDRVRWKREQALNPATQAELEAALQRAVALLEASGISAEESIGGGNNSNHGRKKRFMGHMRSLLQRSQASVAEVRSLHWLFKEVETRQRGQQQR